LDEACRRQQLGEGWFASLEEVPRQAISMSVREILRSRTIICTVPELRKAEAVRMTILGAVGPERPASILRLHPDCHFFLDRLAASLLAF
jgi:glucosamine-6-phosphate deaminase